MTDKAGGQVKTPRTDAVYGAGMWFVQGVDKVPAEGAISRPTYEESIALCRQLEREAEQTRQDAMADSKRLIDDKMKFFERVTNLERDLAEAVAVVRELQREFGAYALPGKREDTMDKARELLAKHPSAVSGERG